MENKIPDNLIKFKITNGQVICTMKEAIALPEFFQVIFTGILSAMNAVVNAQEESNKPQCKEDIYDMLNAAASNTLYFFAPEIEMRPHLTTQAILEAENKIIERAYEEHKKKPPIVNINKQ